jgi:transposase
MIDALKPPKGPMFIMDRGIATAENLKILINGGYRYLVANKEMSRSFNENLGQPLTTAGGDEILIYNEVKDDKSENKLFCPSPKRAAKESAMIENKMIRFEDRLKKLNKSLGSPRTKKGVEDVNIRLGRIMQTYSEVAHYYAINTIKDTVEKSQNEPTKIIRIEYQIKDGAGGKLVFPGVYSLRTNDMTLSNEEIWRTYIRLTRIESVFRSLKSELGLRPIFHHKKRRIDTHLFLSILAYQCINKIRIKLEERNINDSWTKIAATLQTHVRATLSFNSTTKDTIEIRKTSTPEL